MAIDVQRVRAEFEDRGFLLIDDALSAAQVASINAAADADLAKRKDDWMCRGEGHAQHANILPRTDAFDMALDVPAVVEHLRALMGDHISVDEFSVMLRDPTDTVPDTSSWHRDFGIEESRPFGAWAISVVFYTSDVGPNDHCFSIVPHTHNKLIDQGPAEHAAVDEVDINAPAGTALIFHTACVHAAKLKPGSTRRRTLHLYYGYSNGPRVSSHTEIPDRLLARNNPSLPENFFVQKTS